jgi:hypothetical protein
MPTDYTYVVMALSAIYLVLFYLWSTNRILKTDL